MLQSDSPMWGGGAFVLTYRCSPKGFVVSIFWLFIKCQKVPQDKMGSGALQYAHCIEIYNLYILRFCD